MRGADQRKVIGILIGVLVAASTVSAGVATAAAKSVSWSALHLRGVQPPTLDPTYGLPRPLKALAGRLASRAAPVWIWAAQVANNQTIYLRRALSLKVVPRVATLYVTADNHFILFVNGRRLTATNDQLRPLRWSHPQKLDVAGDLRVGRNIFAVEAHNDSGPAGVILWLLAGRQSLLKTDTHWRVAATINGSSWRSSAFNDSHWAPATVVAGYGAGAWGNNLSPWPIGGSSYLAHLYFQPLKVQVLSGRVAFKGLASVPRQLTAANRTRLRPGYVGRCRLAPARRIHVTVHPTGQATPPELLLDFGQEVAGRIEIRGTAGGTIAPVQPPVVQHAVYGVLSDPARTRNVTTIVRNLVRQGQYSFPVNQITALAGDPAYGIVKTLRVRFLWQGKSRVETAHDGGDFSFPWAPGVVIGTGESKGEAIHSPWGGWHLLSLRAGSTAATPWSAFRYAVIKFTGQGPFHLSQLRLDFDYYPVQYRGAFDCSDPLLTKLWYTGAYTAHLCMQQRIWDAPKRDRAMWMGDLQVSGEVINNVFLDHFLMQRTMRDLRENAQGGRPVNELPVSDVNGIPGYSCAWIVGLSDFYRHTGALGYLKSQRQLLLSMLRYLKLQFNPRGEFDNKFKHWCFVDWSGALTGNAPLVATDLYACLAARRGAELLAAMGDRADARRWQRWALRIAAAARLVESPSSATRRNLTNPKTHTFTDTRQVNAMAIYSGVANAQERRAIYRTILCPHCAAWKQIATPYYNYYVISALGDLGRTREALNFVRRYWGGMLREGATTFWEVFQQTYGPDSRIPTNLPGVASGGLPAGVGSYSNSLCHGWSAGVTSWLTEYVLGVRPTSGGFATASIVPHLGDLLWAAGRVPTPRGDIVVRVKALGKGEALKVTLPKSVVHALVGVRGTVVSINGKAAVVVRRSSKRCYIRLVGPGRYTVVGRF